MSEPTTHKVEIEFHYLPELPPEPETRNDVKSYIAADEYHVGGVWYEGDGEWSFWGGGKIYAWAAWPEAPPVGRT